MSLKWTKHTIFEHPYNFYFQRQKLEPFTKTEPSSLQQDKTMKWTKKPVCGVEVSSHLHPPFSLSTPCVGGWHFPVKEVRRLQNMNNNNVYSFSIYSQTQMRSGGVEAVKWLQRFLWQSFSYSLEKWKTATAQGERQSSHLKEGAVLPVKVMPGGNVKCNQVYYFWVVFSELGGEERGLSCLFLPPWMMINMGCQAGNGREKCQKLSQETIVSGPWRHTRLRWGDILWEWLVSMNNF